MKETLLDRSMRLAGAFALQIIPPSLLAAYAAYELSLATSASFAQAAGIITAVLLLCVMVNALRE